MIDNIREKIDNQFSDIKDIVFQNHGSELSLMEKYISLKIQEEGEDSKSAIDMARGYLALFEITSQDYREKFGTLYQCESIKFITRCIENQKIYFDESGKLKIYPNDVVVCIRLSSGTCIDFVIGDFNKLKRSITSNFYILFQRSDISDLKLFTHIYEQIQLEKNFTKRVARILQAEGLLYVKNKASI